MSIMSINNQYPIDYSVRQEALGPGSFILEAPAGSGKTSILIKRFLTLLLAVDKPTEIIALTFTNKAAMEMRKRIVEALEGKGTDGETTNITNKVLDRAKKLKWGDEFPYSLMIMTIDKLAMQLIAQTPILSQSGKLLKIDTNPEELYLASIKEAINDNNDLKPLFSYLKNDYTKIATQALELIKKRDQWLPYINSYSMMSEAQIKVHYENYYKNEINFWLQKIKEIFTAQEINTIKEIVHQVSLNLSDAKIERLQDTNSYQFWSYFRDIILTKSGKLTTKFDKSNGFPPDDNGKELKRKINEILNLKIHKIKLLEDFYNVVDESKIEDIYPIISSVSSLLRHITATLNINFTKSNTVDFIQVLANALIALKETNLAIIFDSKTSHILVDEFQDTNYSQLEFLELLSQNFAGNPDKSFFAVGDPMQSIYRFRKAEVSIFKDAQLSGIGDLKLKSLMLDVNFRSNQNIISWLNTTFKNAFPSEENASMGSICYKPSAFNSVNILGSGVHYRPLLIAAKSNSETYEAEAGYVLNLINEIRAQNPNTEIAVLTQSRPHLKELLTLIKKSGAQLPIDAIEINQIEANQSFQDVLSLAKALFNFSDRVEWIAVLKAPWCGLSINDLTLLLEKDHHSTVWEIINNSIVTEMLNQESQVRLNRLRVVISNNISYRGRVTHTYFIESIWRQLKGPQTMIDSRDLENIDIFFELIEESSSPLSVDFVRLERKLKEIYTSELSNEINPIKFLTIQKSKGLEFDCVIIPNLNRQKRNENKNLILLDKDILSINKNDDTKNLYDYHRFKEMSRLKNEHIRLLYVAITRAKNDCYLIGSICGSNDKDLKPETGTFLEMLWPILKHEYIEVHHKKNHEEYGNFVPKLRRLKIDQLQDSPQPKVNIKTKNLEIKRAIDSENLYTITGKIIHKYFELVIKKQIDIDFILSNKLDYIRSLFVEKKFDENQINEAINLIIKSLNHLKNSPDGRWIYSLHKEEQIESKYQTGLNDKKTILIPDRVFIEDNKRWIIDYKTLFYDKEIDISMEAIKHLPQLNKYAELFSDNYPTQKAIYFATHGQLILI